MILQNAPVETHLMTPDAAIEQGALALFGEKYGDEVRVVSMGVARRQSQSRPRLFHRAMRRHPCQSHRRYRPAQDHRRERRRRRRPPHRGADRRGSADLPRRPGRPRARGRRAAEGFARRDDRQAIGRRSTSAASSSASSPTPSAISRCGRRARAARRLPPCAKSAPSSFSPAPSRAWRPRICAAWSTTPSSRWARASSP